MAIHNELGVWGEAVAARFLQEKGYCVIERDWKSGHRDLDIIATVRDTVVFVEVKTRSSRDFGEPEDAIDYAKIRNLRMAIHHYVRFKHIKGDIRLDIVSVVGTPDSEDVSISHFEDIPLY